VPGATSPTCATSASARPKRSSERPSSLTGRIVKAEEARAIGILLEVTEPDRLLPRAREIATQIAAKPPLAVRYAKRALRLAQHQGLEEHLESCASFQGALQKTEDHLEALAAFFEKRSGVFKGK
jgi:enoyl-CoA hydratase/carnithine racemase